MNLPERITLCEVGPRDGFQFEEKLIPTDLKVEAITALAEAGLPIIQVGSQSSPNSACPPATTRVTPAWPSTQKASNAPTPPASATSISPSLRTTNTASTTPT